MKLKFNVTGMTCAACSARVEKVTKAVPGVQASEVNLLAGTMQVEAERDVSAAIIQAVRMRGTMPMFPAKRRLTWKNQKPTTKQKRFCDALLAPASV